MFVQKWVARAEREGLELGRIEYALDLIQLNSGMYVSSLHLLFLPPSISYTYHSSFLNPLSQAICLSTV